MVQNLAVAIPNVNMDTVDAEFGSFASIPLTALSRNTRRQLSNSLNSKKILRTEEGYERDWRGIALLAAQKNFCDEKSINVDDPMAKVIQLWCENNPKEATFANLQRFLGVIDRWDASDDILENLVEDAKNYKVKQQQQQGTQISRTEEPPVTFTIDDETEAYVSNPELLTYEDKILAQQGLPPQEYDAFVLYADADIEYAQKIKENLEDNPRYKCKLCDKNNIMGGVVVHEAMTKIIDNRCKYLIVVLSNKFLASPENNFYLTYVHSKQIQENLRKIIPVIFEQEYMKMPSALRVYKQLNYDFKSENASYFWDRLAISVGILSVSSPTESTSSSNTLPRPTKETHRQLNGFETVYAPKPTTPPADIPSIKVNDEEYVQDDTDAPMPPQTQPKDTISPRNGKIENILRGEKLEKPQKTSLPRSISQSLFSRKKLRTAKSTSQLNSENYSYTNESQSDISLASACSETKKKKKMPSILKIFRPNKSTHNLRTAV